MTHKEIYETIVDKETMLYQIAPYNTIGLPVNSILYKGRCGIGGSTLEMLQGRNSIITVPTVAPIKGKCQEFTELLTEQNKRHLYNDMVGVMGEDGINRKEKITRIEQELCRTDRYIKLMTTTDSFDCIIEAATNLEKLEWLYDTFFLLLDECHCFVTEAFRPNITIPFRYFWNFKRKCLISATPFEFSDRKFDALEKHKIVINEKLGEIELVEVNDIAGAVHFILTRPDKFPANVHVFYNSITELSERLILAIAEIGEIDCNIFCSKSDDNLKKLGTLSAMFKEEPTRGEYKKFNFYTSRYTEGWDLHDDNATIILITDIKAPHTKVGITNKGVQAVGRLRNKPHRIIHFTNHSDRETKQGSKHFRIKHTHYAQDSITAFNIHAQRAKANRFKPYSKLEDAVSRYGFLAEDGFSAILEPIKIDQWVNCDTCHEEYNNIDFIRQAWEASNYNVILKRVNPNSVPNLKNKKVSEQLKIAFNVIDDLEKNKDNLLFSNDYESAKTSVVRVNKHFELMYKAYHVLSPERIIEIGFDAKALKTELENISDQSKRSGILQLLRQSIQLNHHYRNADIKLQLNKTYSEVNYNKTAVGTHIDEYCINYERDKLGIIIYQFKDQLIDK